MTNTLRSFLVTVVTDIVAIVVNVVHGSVTNSEGVAITAIAGLLTALHLHVTLPTIHSKKGTTKSQSPLIQSSSALTMEPTVATPVVDTSTVAAHGGIVPTALTTTEAELVDIFRNILHK